MRVDVTVEVAKEASEGRVRHAARRQVERATQTGRRCGAPCGWRWWPVSSPWPLPTSRWYVFAGFAIRGGLTSCGSACTASPTLPTPAPTTTTIISANGTHCVETVRPRSPRIRAAHPGQIVVQLDINNGVASTEPMWLQLQQLTDLIQKLVMENASFSDGSHSSSSDF